METLIRIGAFPDALQAVIDREFCCIPPDDALEDEALRTSVRGIITRSNYRVSADLVTALPALKVIATSGVGFDGIPVAEAHRRGIVVTHTPGVRDDAVCELGVGLLLAALRQIPASDRFVRSGSWSSGAFALTRSLAGKAVGIVGLGRIGKGIASRLAAFKVELAYSGSKRADVAYRHAASALELAELVDVLVVCCHGGAQTHHLIDRRVMDALGPEGVLVNLSRGSVVDEAALVEALASGRLGAAALDVFEHEPLARSPLTALPNVVLSPHAGSATQKTRAIMLRLTLDNLHAVLGGAAALTPVPR